MNDWYLFVWKAGAGNFWGSLILDTAVLGLLLPFYRHYTNTKSALHFVRAKFSAHMPFLTATSAFRLGRQRKSSYWPCCLHHTRPACVSIPLSEGRYAFFGIKLSGRTILTWLLIRWLAGKSRFLPVFVGLRDALIILVHLSAGDNGVRWGRWANIPHNPPAFQYRIYKYRRRSIQTGGRGTGPLTLLSFHFPRFWRRPDSGTEKCR